MPLTDLPNISWTLSQASKAAELTLGRLHGFRIRIPTDNRIARARSVLTEGSRIPWFDLADDSQTRVAEAMRTVLEQYLITRSIVLPSKELRERLRWLLEGPDLPRNDAKTSAHDVQFELLTGAVLDLAGIRGVRLEEPDWRIPAGDKDIAVAAKRLCSLKSATKRVRKAIGQIRRQGIPGIVLLNLDQLVRGMSAGEAAQFVTSALKEFRQLVARWNAEDVVFALFGFATSFDWVSTEVGGVLGLRVFSKGEIIASPGDLPEAPRIEAKLRLMGHNIITSAARAMDEIPL